jgi:hypothetical protein
MKSFQVVLEKIVINNFLLCEEITSEFPKLLFMQVLGQCICVCVWDMRIFLKSTYPEYFENNETHITGKKTFTRMKCPQRHDLKCRSRMGSHNSA